MITRMICKEIQDYITLVRSGKEPVCKDQTALCDYVERCFGTEEIYVDEQQLKKYLNLQKYFPFKLLPWEKFIFTLHNCTYRAPGILRWPVLFVLVGRGAGKNGYEAFESFCWITPTNGIRGYNVDIFATAEDQARTSFDDIWEILESHREDLERYFYWNKECITNLRTRSKIRFHTSAPKTKDGGRPGAIVFDELHAFENYRLIGTVRTGLGKKAMPRQTIITTDGYIRGGPLDDTKERAEQILYGGIGDNGMLPYICRLDDRKEADDPEMWPKANPSLIYLPILRQEIETEYADYKQNPIANPDFMTKRMNMPQTFEEASITDWGNILAANKPIPDLAGCSCIGAVDYADTRDFVAAGILFLYNGKYVWITHSWVCKASKDLPRIDAPLEEWAGLGLMDFVDGPSILPEVPVAWLVKQAEIYNVTLMGIDFFRWALLTKAMKDAGFDTDKGGANNVLLTKRVTQMRYVPVIVNMFDTQNIIWENNPMMNWYTYNACIVSEKGNQYFGKKEAVSRKTDGFMALVHAICASENLEDCGEADNLEGFKVYAY